MRHPTSPRPARVTGSRLRRRTAGLVALVVAGATALTGCDIYDVPLPGGADVGDNPMQLHVEFRDVLDLVPQSTVKLDDVTVGKITSIKLKGYTADVTIELPGDLKIPRNERAEIRQTSLLGEKFVSLEKPANPSSALLSDGDVIPLAHTGRNPEVEEVLKALSALLNGGGVAQLKSIAHELNQATDGRESDIRSVLDQIHSFMGELDQNKQAVLSAIDNVDRLSRRLHRQDGAIKQALDELPAAVKSVNGQRADLVRMLKGLDRLSDVGVRVIDQSKEATIDSLRDLAPVLSAFARAGQSLPKSLQVLPTYPFLDAAVGNSPTVARNLHMGDWVNLSILLDLDTSHLVVPGLPDLGNTLAGLCKMAPGPLASMCGPLLDALGPVLGAIPSTNDLTDKLNQLLAQLAGNPPGSTGRQPSATDRQPSATAPTGAPGALLPGSDGDGAGGLTGSGGLLHELLSGLGLGRAEPGAAFRDDTGGSAAESRLLRRADDGVGQLLVQGVTAR